MKYLTTLSLLFLNLSIYANIQPEWYSRMPVDRTSSLPLQAAICEFAGTGHVLSQNTNIVCFLYENNWIDGRTNFMVQIDVGDVIMTPSCKMILLTTKKIYIR